MDVFGKDLLKVFLILDVEGSDFFMLDNVLEFFVLVGCKLVYVVMMFISEFWFENLYMLKEKCVFYEYYSVLMELWDGLIVILFMDGK